MSKMFPDFQTFVDTRDGKIFAITKVTINDATSSDVVLPRAEDAQLLQADDDTADPVFYLSGNNNTVFNIDGATLGDVHYVVSRHAFVNFKQET